MQEPQRSVSRVVLGAPRVRCVRQHPLGQGGGVALEQLAAFVGPSGLEEQSLVRGHGVAGPCAEPRVAGDDVGTVRGVDDERVGGQQQRRVDLVARAALNVAGDDRVQLVHLEPVEHATRDGLDQIARFDLCLRAQVATYERRPLENHIVELPPCGLVCADTAHEATRLQPLPA